MAKESMHAESSAGAVEGSHRKRKSETAKKLLKWGFGSAVVGVGLLLAGQLFAPLIPVTAVTKAVLPYVKPAGKWLVAMGGILAGLGAGKAIIDKA